MDIWALVVPFLLLFPVKNLSAGSGLSLNISPQIKIHSFISYLDVQTQGRGFCFRSKKKNPLVLLSPFLCLLSYSSPPLLPSLSLFLFTFSATSPPLSFLLPSPFYPLPPLSLSLSLSSSSFFLITSPFFLRGFLSPLCLIRVVSM